MPIKGETRSFGIQESQTVPFTVSSLGITVTKPDGTNITPDPGVAADPGTSSLNQTIYTSFELPDAGIYNLVWEFNTDTQGPVIRRNKAFVGFFDIQHEVRRLLKKSATVLPDSDIDPEIILLISRLETNYASCVSPYRNLANSEDQYWLDHALAAGVAARILSSNPGMFIRDGVKSIADGRIRYEFITNPGDKGVSGQSRAEELISRYVYNLSQISCLSAIFTAKRESYSMFAMTGPRRGYASTLSGDYKKPFYNILIERGLV